MSDYTAIDSEKIITTIERLKDRIEERFPESGLHNVCGQLHQVAGHMKQRSEWVARPVHWLRILTWVVCILILIGTFGAIYAIGSGNGQVDIVPKKKSIDLTSFVTLLEAGINDVVLIGAAIFFFLTFETRYKRTRALKALHELRSIAHVIDMHQLTKDPHRVMAPGKAVFIPGRMSPKMNMTQFELRRYLDYCSEMLSLTGKIAAVYNQAFDDGVATAAASELESLTTGLASKIWQKILILESSGDNSATPRIDTNV